MFVLVYSACAKLSVSTTRSAGSFASAPFLRISNVRVPEALAISATLTLPLSMLTKSWSALRIAKALALAGIATAAVPSVNR